MQEKFKKYSGDYQDLKKGQRIKIRDRIGTLITDSKYVSTSSMGYFTAGIEWDNEADQNNVLLNDHRLEVAEKQS